MHSWGVGRACGAPLQGQGPGYALIRGRRGRQSSGPTRCGEGLPPPMPAAWRPPTDAGGRGSWGPPRKSRGAAWRGASRAEGLQGVGLRAAGAACGRRVRESAIAAGVPDRTLQPAQPQVRMSVSGLPLVCLGCESLLRALCAGLGSGKGPALAAPRWLRRALGPFAGARGRWQRGCARVRTFRCRLRWPAAGQATRVALHLYRSNTQVAGQQPAPTPAERFLEPSLTGHLSCC